MEAIPIRVVHDLQGHGETMSKTQQPRTCYVVPFVLYSSMRRTRSAKKGSHSVELPRCRLIRVQGA